MFIRRIRFGFTNGGESGSKGLDPTGRSRQGQLETMGALCSVLEARRTFAVRIHSIHREKGAAAHTRFRLCLALERGLRAATQPWQHSWTQKHSGPCSVHVRRASRSTEEDHV